MTDRAHLDASGDLVIPFADSATHYWADGRSIRETLEAPGADAETMERHVAAWLLRPEEA